MSEDASKSKNMPLDENNLHEDRVPFNVMDNEDSGGDILNREPAGTDTERNRVYVRSPTFTGLTQKFPTRCSQFALFLAVVLLIILLIFIGLWAVQRKTISDMPCLERNCIITASEILSHMDTSVSPCDNFYEYACNGWIRNNNIPSGMNTWSLLRKLTTNVDHYAKDLLENATVSQDYGIGLAQTYYSSCMNVSQIESRGYAPLFKHIEKDFGGWVLLPTGHAGARRADDSFLTVKNFDLTEHYLPLLRYYRYTGLFQLHVGQHHRNTSHFLIELGDGILTMQREHYVNESHPYYVKQTKALRKVMANFASLLGVPQEHIAELEETFQFEKQLALRMPDRTERDPESDYEITTVTGLSQKCPVLNWKKLLSEIYAPLNYTITDDQTVSLTDHVHFLKRCQFFADHLKTDAGIRTLHNGVIWSVLWSTMAHLPKDVEQITEEYREAESGVKVKPARWIRCIKETLDFFGNPIGRAFINDRFPKRSKTDATKMIEAIKEAFIEHLDTVYWMDEPDKQHAIEKVNAMKASVAYPENIYDKNEDKRIYGEVRINELNFFENALAISEALFIESLRTLIDRCRDKWDLAPLVVNAFYKENANHIYFPAGILQRPVYDPAYPMSLNYGGIGMVVGHEITHGFDQFGSKRDAQGNMRESWSQKTRNAFEKHSKCMIEQYDNYTILNTSLNGKMTLGENIADNGGIKAAYKAFKKLLGDNTDEPVLPGVSLTSDQLFFLSFAQLWCVNSFPEQTLNTVLFDQHSVEPFRVIGTLSNSEDFARVYNCPSGSPMNPVKKCAVW